MGIDTQILIRIIVHLMAFIISLFTLSGVDFKKVARRGKEAHVFLVYILCSIALGYLVAQFLLNISLK